MRALFCAVVSIGLCLLVPVAAMARTSPDTGTSHYSSKKHHASSNSHRSRGSAKRTHGKHRAGHHGRRGQNHRGRRSGRATASRACLTPPARALLNRIEARFGRAEIISTCRPGARIATTGRVSRHASGNAIDFKIPGKKRQVVQWLIANHHNGGTMTYSDMDHIHVDVGPHFVALNRPSGNG